MLCEYTEVSQRRDSYHYPLCYRSEERIIDQRIKLKSCIFTLHFKSRLATQFSKRNIYFWQVDVLWISENHKFILLRVFYLILWKIYSTWKDIIIWINPSRRHSYFFFFAKHYKNCSWDCKIYWYKQSKKESSDRNSTLQTQFFLCTWTMKELIDY